MFFEAQNFPLFLKGKEKIQGQSSDVLFEVVGKRQ